MPDAAGNSPRKPIAFIDLAAQRARIGDRIEAAIGRVLDHGAFIMGPEVKELERQLAVFAGVAHCVTCANGTEALALVLMAKEVGEGDAVFVPAFTFVATAEVVAWVGATPIFVDVDRETFNIDPVSLERGIETARAMGLRPCCVMPVDLFGQPADYKPIRAIAEANHMFVLADAAQSFGAEQGNRRVGSLAEVTSTSFFPAKPLGCYGDGGAVLTDDTALAAAMRSIRVHGQGSDKYDNVRIGLNARLDTIQAAILLEKLAIFPEEIAARQLVADRYSDALGEIVRVPRLAPGNTSVWAQYTIVTPRRDAVARACKEAGVPTAIYYPIPLSRQTGYRHFPCAPGGVPVSEALSEEVISLPMHPYLEAETQDRVIAAVRAGLQPG